MSSAARNTEIWLIVTVLLGLAAVAGAALAYSVAAIASVFEATAEEETEQVKSNNLFSFLGNLLTSITGAFV